MSGQHKATLSHFATVHEYKAYCKGYEEASKELAAARALLKEVSTATIGELQSTIPRIRSFLEGK